MHTGKDRLQFPGFLHPVILAGLLPCTWPLHAADVDRGGADYDLNPSPCERIRQARATGEKVETNLVIFKFLDEQGKVWEASPSYELLTTTARAANVHRTGGAWERYKAECRAEIKRGEREPQFCTDFRYTDKLLIEKQQAAEKAYVDYATKSIRGNPDFMALGEAGQPLATDYTSFMAAHRKHERRRDEWRREYPRLIAEMNKAKAEAQRSGGCR